MSPHDLLLVIEGHYSLQLRTFLKSIWNQEIIVSMLFIGLKNFFYFWYRIHKPMWNTRFYQWQLRITDRGQALNFMNFFMHSLYSIKSPQSTLKAKVFCWIFITICVILVQFLISCWELKRALVILNLTPWIFFPFENVLESIGLILICSFFYIV